MTGVSAGKRAAGEVSVRSAGGFRLSHVPQLGGKVTSLRYGESGRQWLAAPVRPLAAPSRADQPWGELDCSGWDECFPNVGSHHRLALLDHGEVWRHPWHHEAAGANCGDAPGVSGWVCPPGREYRFNRDIRTLGSRLDITYRIDNSADEPLPWAWAQHLLLAADERTRLVLPAPARLRLDSAFWHGRPHQDLRWLLRDDELASSTRLDRSRGHAAKLWFTRPLPPIVAVVNGSDWLAWRIGQSTPTALGLWVNLGGWGEHAVGHVAVEPAFGANDDPLLAYAESSALDAGQSNRWRVVIEAGTGLAELDVLLHDGRLW